MFRFIDENRISIAADTNYTGLLVEVEGQVETGENPLVFIGENSVRLLTGLKNITVSYSLTGGSNIMGFLPTPNLAGFNTGDTYNGAPGLPFLFGTAGQGLCQEGGIKRMAYQKSGFQQPLYHVENRKPQYQRYL